MRFTLLLAASIGAMMLSIPSTMLAEEVDVVAMRAFIETDSSSGPVAQLSSRLEGIVRVENIAYEKKLVVAYRVGEETFEVPASFLRLEQEPYELWSFVTESLPIELGANAGHTYHVSVSYSVSGEDYVTETEACVSAGPRPVCPSEYGEMTLFE